MIAYLSGTIIDKKTNEIILMVNGIGFLITCSINTFSMLPKVDESCDLFIKMVVREDAMDLYGFYTEDEKKLFNLLTTITGIGPKTAVGILGTMSLNDLKTAIAMNDIVALSRAPGIGKKTAQRIALELREKLSDEMLISSSDGNINMENIPEGFRDSKNEALVALKTLGYTQVEASNAIRHILKEHNTQSMGSDEIIRFALKSMSNL